MAYLDDFCDHTLTFLAQNIVYVIVSKETNGLKEVVVEPRAPALPISNIPVGVANGIVSGGVYKLRSRTPADARGLTIYFCGYEQNKTISLVLGNQALFMFTATMNGCTFGVGIQGPGANGSVRVAHANNGKMAAPGTIVGGNTGRTAQIHTQSMLATSYVGPGGLLIEPDSYMGADLGQQATTFGYHAANGAWTFRALAYRMGGGTSTHEGIVNYP